MHHPRPSQLHATVSRATVLACQVLVPPMTTADGRDRHVRRTADAVRVRLSERPADLVVLPELSSIAYSDEAFASLAVLGEALDGPSVECYQALARETRVTVVFGIARRTGKTHRISQVAVGPQGQVLGHFDKLHRANFGFSAESPYFSAGDHLFVFECAGLRFAPIICYDIRFPELTRTLVLDRHADVILHCGAYGRDESFDSWHAFVTTRAMENQVPVLSLNRAGEAFGDSLYCDAWVDADNPPLRFPAHDEAFRYIDIDTSATDRVRSSYGWLEDRFESYGDLPLLDR